ncbi:MAG TPA: hypothetical protein VLC09_06615 [Polyangiaceae bacterium]|nr:hypothetical protein [Polyangiaceae bacterium]
MSQSLLRSLTLVLMTVACEGIQGASDPDGAGPDGAGAGDSSGGSHVATGGHDAGPHHDGGSGGQGVSSGGQGGSSGGHAHHASGGEAPASGGASQASGGSGGSGGAPVVSHCTSFVDRSAPDAQRRIVWDFTIASSELRCLRVAQGQTVVFVGEFGTHPLGESGGTQPNPIQGTSSDAISEYSVSFPHLGTFGYECGIHATMRGAVEVVTNPMANPITNDASR